MRTIYKYPLPAGECAISLPAGAKFLHVAEQGGRVSIWAEVETDNPAQMRRIKSYGTGFEMLPENRAQHHFIGTFMTDGGQYVWHVYEITSP